MEQQRHPARYNKKFLPIFAKMLDGSKRVFDPCAGDGVRFKELHDTYLPDSFFFGTEIEPEWAYTIPNLLLCRDAFEYMKDVVDSFWDAILVSPVYGNRMSDSFIAKDASKRNTYTHRLGRQLSENNSGKLQWGDEYRDFHSRLWKECIRILKPEGKFILNVKDHIRKGEQQFVTDWHIKTIEDLGMNVIEHIKVNVPSLKNGENSNLRIPYESVLLFIKG
jgi:hypothetical protein